ncbi:hypothetical protein F3Y22_tig00010533pilonHSYRG00033 [Hibiscus syriacus]|uniref:Uncharacterized protein n=1 Tax=Hibiscus syriacus TaxID=106335 RepID=A0A6A3C5B7_HIBSY|nr:uncharacterized protein LOC120203941 [Hibiscus syriacus]XP_039060004.1 uncharacterized protein LOC120203941 [Hibiscus syriacus]KAE8724233.1 hypothetical protein F3Y22_tig00010533pilonHSYRG00033 [Hibiscus syriacus]
MMARIPMRFNYKIAAAFDEAARAVSVVRHCESSGSDHSPEDLSDLSDLVNSFLESDCAFESDEHEGNKKTVQEKDNENDGSSDSEGYWSETKDTLKRLVVKNEDDDKEKLKILEQVAEFDRRNVSDMSSEGFKRRLMYGLRDNGFDAGLCKSRWEKFGRHPAGRYEYVDVNANGTRYIIEINLAGEFKIARPTMSYASLIEVFPTIFVEKPEKLKQIVRLMCKAMRKSMKDRDMKMPPWRQHGYMQAKWFAAHKRTTDEISSSKKSPKKNGAMADAAKRSVGFKELPTISYRCRDNTVADKAGLKVGYLSAAFNANAGIGLQS